MSAQLNPVEYFVCGGVGGMCTVLVGHPLDTVKVRLQTMPVVKLGELPMYRGTWDCLAKTVHNEGVKGLYKGMAAPLTGVSPIFAISFFGYGVGKQIFKANVHDKSMPRIFAAGAFSGIFTTVIMTPGERIKCLLQIQQGQVDKKYAGPVDCAKQLYRAGGMKSIYRGTVATLLRDVPASGLYFLTYETLSSYFTKVGEKPSIATTIFAGGMAGISNWLVGMPADVLKSRLQTAPEGTYKHGLKEVFAELMRKEGVFALYKGITPVMLRAFPANAACFLGFELAAGVIKRLHSS